MYKAFCSVIAMLVAFVFVVGCDRISSPMQPLTVLEEMEDVYTPQIQRWHVYDNDVLSVSWDAVPGAARYVVSLQEDHGGPMGVREETLTWQIVKGTTATFVRNPRYFADRVNTTDRAKWFAVNILPVAGDIENRLEVKDHPWDYDHMLIGHPTFIPFFWYEDKGGIDRLKAFVDTYAPKPEVLGFADSVTGHQEIVFNSPEGPLPAGVQYQVIAYGEQNELLYSTVQIAVGTGSDAPLWREKGITLPDGIRAHSVSVRPVWEVDRHWVTGEWDITDKLVDVDDVVVELIPTLGFVDDIDQQLELEAILCYAKVLMKEIERIEAGGDPRPVPTGQDLELEIVLCQIELLLEQIDDLRDVVIVE